MHAFPPSARLHRPSEFAPALKGQRIARGDLLVLTVPRSAPQAAAAPAAAATVPLPAAVATTQDETIQPAPVPVVRARLGMVIAKRHAKRAVVRNAIKRVLREAFRHQQALLPARDYVFRLHNRVDPQSLTQLKQQVRQEADALLRKARRR